MRRRPTGCGRAPRRATFSRRSRRVANVTSVALFASEIGVFCTYFGDKSLQRHLTERYMTVVIITSPRVKNLREYAFIGCFARCHELEGRI